MPIVTKVVEINKWSTDTIQCVCKSCADEPYYNHLQLMLRIEVVNGYAVGSGIFRVYRVGPDCMDWKYTVTLSEFRSFVYQHLIINPPTNRYFFESKLPDVVRYLGDHYVHRV